MERGFVPGKFVITQPGEPYRLFPFGTIYKGGKKREITPEYAAQFRLPHFKPPIKLGSHNEDQPAGGHIVGLEVREDGLYAVPEMNEQGLDALGKGSYRYHSPEVIWSGGYENPDTGELIPGPMIVGDALLHNPHMGEKAALYEVTPLDKEKPMAETVEVPKTLWEKFEAYVERLMGKEEEQPAEPPAAPAVPPVEETEEYKAAAAERDNLKAELDALKAEKAAQEARAALIADLQTDAYGTTFSTDEAAQEAAGMLAGMSEEQRAWVLKAVKAQAALAKQGEAALTSEVGSTGQGMDDPKAALNAAILARAAEKNISYLAAQAELLNEKPELFQVYQK